MRPSERAAALCGHLSSIAIGPFPAQGHRPASARQTYPECLQVPCCEALPYSKLHNPAHAFNSCLQICNGRQEAHFF